MNTICSRQIGGGDGDDEKSVQLENSPILQQQSSSDGAEHNAR